MKLGSLLGLGAGALVGSVALEVFLIKDGFVLPPSQTPGTKGAACDPNPGSAKLCAPGLRCSNTGLFQDQCIDTSFEVKRAAIGTAFVGGGALLGYWLGGKL